MYHVILTHDGIARTFSCESHYDTVILFDALHRGAQWDSLIVRDTRTGFVCQSAFK